MCSSKLTKHRKEEQVEMVRLKSKIPVTLTLKNTLEI